MNENRDTTRQDIPEYECIDPVLGEQMWRLADKDCPADLKERLATHLTFCAHCRLQASFNEKMGEGLESGELRLRKAPAGILAFPGVVRTWSTGLGAVALAAGLALLMMLPPRTALDGKSVRNADQAAAITSPVADEVVLGGRPQLSWTPLEGATRYEVSVQQVGSDESWITTTTEAEVQIPEGMELDVGQRYRVMVETVPRHVGPSSGMNSSFSTGNPGQWLGYRLGHGQRSGQVLGVLGALLLAGALFMRPRR
jgi:hypothetical protein